MLRHRPRIHPPSSSGKRPALARRPHSCTALPSCACSRPLEHCPKHLGGTPRPAHPSESPCDYGSAPWPALHTVHRCQHSFTNTYHTGSTSPNLEPCPEHPNCMPYLNTPAQWARFSSLGPALALCSPCPVTVTHLAFRRELQFSAMAGLTTAQLDHCLVGVRRTRAWSDRDTAWLTAGHGPRSPGFGPTTALVDHNLAASGPGHGWDTTQLGQQLAMGPCSSGPGQQSPAGHHANATNHTPDSVGGMITRAQSHTG